MREYLDIAVFVLIGLVAGVIVMAVTGGVSPERGEERDLSQKEATDVQSFQATSSSEGETDRPNMATTTSTESNEQEEATTSEETNRKQSPMAPEEMRGIIREGVEWLKQAQEESGHFRYEYRPLGGTYSDDDLMARQAGAAFVLGKTLRYGNDPFAVHDTLVRAFEYFQSQSRNGEYNGYEFRCVLRKEGVCSLGATSLVLTSMLDYMETFPERAPRYRFISEKYRNFILAMKKADEGFRGFYHFGRDRQPVNESHFSNGEAYLALVHYNNRHPDSDEAERALEESFDYFAERYRTDWNWNFYLWGMAAIQQLPEEKRTEEHYRFVRDFTDWRIAGFQNNRGSWYNSCAYIEGVISAYDILKERLTEAEERRYTNEIRYWLNRSAGLQVTEEGVPLWAGDTINRIVPVDPERAIGGFVTALDTPKLRIDFTQHCVSSYMQWLTEGLSLPIQ